MNAGIFNDFSGGITDFYLPGKPNQFKVLDNVVVLSDRTVEQRPGWALLGAGLGQLPTGYQRIAQLAVWDKETRYAAFTEKRVYHVTGGAWTHLLGPSGSPAFNSANTSVNVQTAEWQRHLFATSDSGDRPVKLFYDDTNTLRLRTAGMPEVPDDLLYPADGGLADALALANDLLTQMIAHTADASASTTIPKAEAHITHATLTAQNATLTALAPATDLATLISNLNTMRAVYHEHILDAQASWQDRDYHVVTSVFTDMPGVDQISNTEVQPFLNFTALDEDATLSGTIDKIIPYLNDLRDKWNYHTYALWTHGNAIDQAGSQNYTGAGLYATSLARVETYTWAKLSPNYDSLISFVRKIYNEFRAHQQNDTTHRQADSFHLIPSAWYDAINPPNTIQEAVIALGAIAFYLARHTADSLKADFYSYLGTSTVGSPTLTSVSPTPAFPITTPGAYYLVPLQGSATFPGLFYKSYTFDADGYDPLAVPSITGTTGTTITLNINAIQAVTSQWIFTNSKMHFGKQQAGLTTFSGLRQGFDALDLTLQNVTSLQGIADLAKAIADNLKAHELDGLETLDSDPKIFANGNFYDRYLDKGQRNESIANAQSWSVHAAYSQTAAGSVEGTYFPYSGIKQDSFETAPQAASINYTMLFSNTYKVGDTEYVDKGKPATPINIITYQSELSSDISEQSRYAINVSNWYSYVNAANENYDTAGTGFKKELYRTPANGTLYYLTTVDGLGGKYPNSTTSLLEISNEAYIDSQEALYTNGGIVENDAAPIARYIHIVDNVAYYGYITDGADVYKNRILQSVIGDPDSVPRDFFIDLDDSEVTGISSYKSQVIAFGERNVYRLEGIFDLLGRGGLVRSTISQDTGCISPNSVVQTDIGVFFAGISGFYYTDGYQVLKVTDHLDESYSAVTNTEAKRKNIRGTYDKYTRRIYFTVGDGSTPNQIWVLHLDFGVSKSMCVTTWSGGFAGANEYYPTAVAILNKRPLVATVGGYVLDHKYDRYMDLKADTSVSPDSWVTYPVLWNIKTCDHDYGSSFMRKYSTKLSAQFKQTTNLSVQIYNDVDRGRLIGTCAPIRSRKLSDWGDLYLEKPSDWTPSSGGVIDERRHFMAGTLRWNYMAVELKNAYVVITRSTVIGTATVTGSTVTLDNGAKKWPEHVVGYDIEIAGTTYSVIQRNSDTVITVAGSPNAGSQAWVLWGYPKNEFMHLVAFNVSYDILGLTQKAFGTQETDSGDNG